MSKTFAARLGHGQIPLAVEHTVLQPRLRALVNAPLVRQAGGLLLEPLVSNTTGPDQFPDYTGYEAFINKVHVDDLIEVDGTNSETLNELIRQGAKAAIELACRLENEGRFRVLLSLDPDSATATLRFFKRRDGEAWGADDPDAFQLEEVLMIDTGA